MQPRIKEKNSLVHFKKRGKKNRLTTFEEDDLPDSWSEGKQGGRFFWEKGGSGEKNEKGIHYMKNGKTSTEWVGKGSILKCFKRMRWKKLPEK